MLGRTRDNSKSLSQCHVLSQALLLFFEHAKGLYKPYKDVLDLDAAAGKASQIGLYIILRTFWAVPRWRATNPTRVLRQKTGCMPTRDHAKVVST
eukprot:4886536-Pleurochrysis_carterae.AAC.1